MTAITKQPWGRTAKGTPVQLYTLQNAAGMRVGVTNYGGTIVFLEVPDRRGRPTDVVLGYDSLSDYERGDKYIGATIGRYANRIGGARFCIDGREYTLTANEGENHLHGGRRGFDRKVWRAETVGEALLLSCESRDGEEGYPGNLSVSAAFSLTEDNALSLEYRARSDADTLCSLTNHSYFNLNGAAGGDILEHRMRIFADFYTPAGPDSLPDGRLCPVSSTPFDFREPVRIGERIDRPHPELRAAGGYDQNWAVRGWDGSLRPAAAASSGQSGISLEVLTTLPGVQFYTGNYLDGVLPGKGGSNGRRCGFCLETQFFPNSPAHPNFPSPILRRGEEYRHTTLFRFRSDGD